MLGAAWLPLGCGGRVIDDSGAGGSAASAPAPADTAASHAGKRGASDPSTTLPSKALGECKPGFDHAENPTRPCHWLSESGLCFDDSEDACNCICPSDHDSICAHGFDQGPSGATLIVCD